MFEQRSRRRPERFDDGYAVTERMLGQRGELVDRISRLTSREWETLGLMREGLETSEMAERLDLTPATIRSHIAAILRKLGVPDRRTAVRIAAGRGEISTGE